MTEMLFNYLPLAAILAAALGVVFGAGASGAGARRLGLLFCQVGLAIAGLAMIAGSLVRGDDGAVWGFLLLVLGTGVTAIGRRPSADGSSEPPRG